MKFAAALDFDDIACDELAPAAVVRLVVDRNGGFLQKAFGLSTCGYAIRELQKLSECYIVGVD